MGGGVVNAMMVEPAGLGRGGWGTVGWVTLQGPSSVLQGLLLGSGLALALLLGPNRGPTGPNWQG